MPVALELQVDGMPNDIELSAEQPSEMDLNAFVKFQGEGGEDIGLVVRNGKICVRYNKED